MMPFHIAHGFAGDMPVPMRFELSMDGELLVYDFFEKTVVSEDPLLITKVWVHNFPEGINGTHTFTGNWLIACGYAVLTGQYDGPCPNPKELVVVHSNTKVFEAQDEE